MEKKAVDLFSFFWRELELMGARVYTGIDYDEAIDLIASGKIDCNKLITDMLLICLIFKMHLMRSITHRIR